MACRWWGSRCESSGSNRSSDFFKGGHLMIPRFLNICGGFFVLDIRSFTLLALFCCGEQ